MNQRPLKQEHWRSNVGLEWTLKAKIVLTAALWSLPLTLLPEYVVHHWIGLPSNVPTVFYRLLGAAYLALLVGYLHGLERLTIPELCQCA